MPNKPLCVSLAAIVLSCASLGFAQAPASADDAVKLKAFIDSLHFRSGDIVVQEAKARFHTGPRKPRSKAKRNTRSTTISAFWAGTVFSV
jgi:hypothetical protein